MGIAHSLLRLQLFRITLYFKKTNRQSWSTEQMEQALQAVVSCQLGYAKASRQFNVPQTTLERYVKKNVRKIQKALF
jgi:transposase-like protein